MTKREKKQMIIKNSRRN